MSRDYDFWVYIVTNQTDSVLYIGVTNDLSRRLNEHRSARFLGSRQITDVTNSFIGSIILTLRKPLRAKNS